MEVAISTCRVFLFVNNSYISCYSYFFMFWEIQNYVFKDPSDEFPSGLVYTGCQDGKIRAFLPDIEDPLFLLEGHEENVTSIFVGK